MDLAKLQLLVELAPGLERMVSDWPRVGALLEQIATAGAAAEEPRPLREIRGGSARAAVMFERRHPELVRLSVGRRSRTRLYRPSDVRAFMAKAAR